MRSPYGLEQTDNCVKCNRRSEAFFCQLSPAAIKDLNAIKSTSMYPAGAVLFLERQEPRGVFMLCEGEIKLSVSSSEGKTLILRIAKPGEVLGLMPAMSGSPYEATAETLHPCQVAFIRRDDFLRFIAKHPEAYGSVVKQLSSYYWAACEQLRTLGLSASAVEKLARLLLEWSATGKETREGTLITMPLTHQEIAEFIGTTRETVTRTLTDFKNQHFVSLKGSALTIFNRAALENFVTV